VEAKAQQAESRAAQAELRAAQAESRAAQADAASAQHVADLVALHQSTSWKITAPLRSAKDAMTVVFGASQTRQQQGSGLKHLAKRTYFFTRRMGVKLIRRQITWLKLLVGRSPFILNIAKKMVSSSPRLKTFLARALGAGGHHAYTSRLDGVALTHELAALTPRARSLYRRLRQNVGTDEAGP
jgi:O-antigen chain-terminating methyltransferase